MTAPWSFLFTLLLAALPGAVAQDGVAVLSTAVVLALIGLCVGLCCCAGIGCYTVMTNRVVDYAREEDGS